MGDREAAPERPAACACCYQGDGTRCRAAELPRRHEQSEPASAATVDILYRSEDSVEGAGALAEKRLPFGEEVVAPAGAPHASDLVRR